MIYITISNQEGKKKSLLESTQFMYSNNLHLFSEIFTDQLN